MDKDKDISTAIVSFIMAIALLFMPSMMDVLQNTMGANAPVAATPGTIGALSSQINESMKGVMSMLSVFAYLGAIAFGVKGALVFKAMNETKQETPVVLQKEEKPKEEIKPLLKPLDFESDLLNSKVKAIITKAHELKKLNLLAELPESELFVENIEPQYLTDIWKNYIKLPKNLREGKVQKDVLGQLELLEQGLVAVEKKALEHVNKKQEINKRFLDNKLADMG